MLECIKSVGLAFVALFLFNAGYALIDDWERWHPVFLIMSLFTTLLDFLIFALVPLLAIAYLRISGLGFIISAIIGIAIWTYMAGSFYVSLTGAGTLQLGQTVYIQNGQMMLPLYLSKLKIVLALYAVVEGWTRLSEVRRSRRQNALS